MHQFGLWEKTPDKKGGVVPTVLRPGDKIFLDENAAGTIAFLCRPFGSKGSTFHLNVYWSGEDGVLKPQNQVFGPNARSRFEKLAHELASTSGLNITPIQQKTSGHPDPKLPFWISDAERRFLSYVGNNGYHRAPYDRMSWMAAPLHPQVAFRFSRP